MDETKPYEEEFEKEKEEKEQELDSEYVVAGGEGECFSIKTKAKTMGER